MSIEIARSATSSRFRRTSRFRSILILITVFTVSIAAASAETATDQELDPRDWPVTVQDAVRDFLPRVTLFERLKIKLTKKENIVALYIDFGTQIRNRYGLWRGNEKLILSACGYRCHPDDASMKIVEAVWREVQDSP